jgi:hypothetical protein
MVENNYAADRGYKPMDSEPKFDIFSGAPDKDAVWVECVRGLSNARERMEQIAAKKPGRYFLFSNLSHSILAKIETFSKPQSVSAKSNNAA